MNTSGQTQQNKTGTDFLSKVGEFNKVAGNLQYTPTTVPIEIYKLRESLIYEEYQELLEGIASGDKVEQLDALADLLYVIYGFIWVKNEPMIFFNGPKEIRKEVIIDMSAHLCLRLKATLVAANDLNLFTQLEEAFNRVHESNMSKFCKTELEAGETVYHYKLKGIYTYYKKVDDLYVVLRVEDNKVLKSINYTPVDLKDLV